MSNNSPQTIKEKLDTAEQKLSPEIVDELHAARRHALDQLNKPKSFFSSPLLKIALPVGGVATAASLALMVSFFTLNDKPADIAPSFAEGDMLVLTEDFALIEELSFYDWVLANEIAETES